MIRLYRLLLHVFPAAVRREFGDEMARMFAAQLQQARTAGRSVTRLWLLAFADAIVNGAGERAIAARSAGRRFVAGFARWRWWMRALLQDVRYAARLLLKQPVTSTVALLTLALGVGANTAIFSAVNAVLLRPLPYPEPDRLMMLFEKRVAEGVMDNPVSPADFLDWSRMQSAFERIAAFTTAAAHLTGAGDPVSLNVGTVSPPFFDVLGILPAIGRTFRPEEATAGQHRVAILTHRVWQQRFGSDTSLAGRTILLNAQPHVVVGILPASFEFPDADIDLWTPLVLQKSAEPPPRANHYLDVYGRLRPGVGVEQARADMDRIGAALAAQYPDENRNHRAHVIPLGDRLTQPFRTGLLLLLGAVSFVLLIACVNVANLLLAKAASRRREMAVRAAGGAGRARLAGQALTESLLLALLGGALGLIVARWGIDLLRALAPRGVPVLGLDHLGLEPRVLVFAMAISTVSGLLFGLLPALQIAGQDVNEALKDGGRGGGRGVRKRLPLVALRTSEIGIRMTLGATASGVMALVLREGLLQAAVGLTIGIAGAMLVMRSFRAVLYEVTPADPLTVGAVAVLLAATAIVACLVPARRAMRVDPVTALRAG